MINIEDDSSVKSNTQLPFNDVVGGKWWSLDIHAHSPASFDYGGLEGEKCDAPKPTYEGWIQAYIDAGIDGIVVADHNSHEGIDRARDALKTLQKSDPDLRSFVIFPGVELTLSGGYHALVVFDYTSDASIIVEILALCHFTGTRGRSDHVANITVEAAAKAVHDRGGLFIPAHIDQTAGVLSMDERELGSLSACDHIVAAEVADDDKVKEADKRGWVAVLGSDAHHLTTEGAPDPALAKAPGTHMTMIKAGALTLEGIRLALAEASESIRRSRWGDPDLNDVKHDHVRAIKVKHKGTVRDYTFGPWMNCLIGGRGVGKSTLIELLRLAHGRVDELPAKLTTDLIRFAPSAEPSERWWDDQTEIEVIYIRNGQLLRISWTGALPTQPSIELWDDAVWVTQSGRIADRAPIRVFSQKQIYELASKPQSFLQLLDDMPEIRKSEWQEQYEQLQIRFKNERNKLRQLLSESEQADRLRGQLQEVQARLRHLEVLRSSTEYATLTKLESKIRSTTSSGLAVTEVETVVARQADTLRALAADVDTSTEYSAYVASFARAASLLDQARAVLTEAQQAWTSSGVEETWKAEIERLGEWVNEQGGASETSVAQTSTDRELETELKAKLQEFENADARRSAQQSIISEVLHEIDEKRTELFTRRRECTTHLNQTQGTRTKLEVFLQGSIADLGDELRTLLRTPDSFESAFAPEGIPALIGTIPPQSPQFAQKISDFKSKLIDLVKQGSESEIAASMKINARFYSRLASIDAFDLITDIMLWYPDDLIRVMYQEDGGANFVPVDRGSPGQRTAALLAVILQMGNEPLLLDQPEDDLENKLIRYLAVETLKRIKQSRQLIVSTHNANVVVTSGAENILVLEYGEALPGIEAFGTLQESVVRDNVREILEGGEDAIRTRYRRLVDGAN